MGLMGPSDPFKAYLRELKKNLATGDATEHTHRPALKSLLEALGDGILATNEPKRVECGAPDYVITRNICPVGYVEAKDIGTNLDAAEKSDQLRRYRSSLNNLILTDYLEFRWYLLGEKRQVIQVGNLTSSGTVKASVESIPTAMDLIRAFYAQEVPILARPKVLAQRMAVLARMLRSLIEQTFDQETEEGSLHAQIKAFRDTLIPGLDSARFADMYAQTITYGLFASRVRVATGQGFTREKAAWNLPKTNPFLRSLFGEIAGPNLDDRIAWLVDDIAHMLARADMAEILSDFGKRSRREDPVVHFYETFLSEYDSKMRQTRGVFYTPEPVVSYIVRSLDHLLITRFDRSLGLADTSTFILDPAVGTATFLYFVIDQIHNTLVEMGQAGAWNQYVKNHLLSRVFGFELLMAPYAVAHMKLGLQLQETGYDFADDQRLGIYLTNSLEEAIIRAETLGFARFISDEANAAAGIKKEIPIMVVLGNPPYSVSSANKGEHIESLMQRYKGAVRRERNIQPLSDDYIKFIRFAHDRIERTGYGVLGMITNNAYISGLIHRGMREDLLSTFNEIFILNLHGSSLTGEVTPTGEADDNVFDIRQGVAISLFVKGQGTVTKPKVFYADLWGNRDHKYHCLFDNDVSTTCWEEIEPGSPYYFFVPADTSLLSEYERFVPITRIFPAHSSGMNTLHDRFVISIDREPLVSMVHEVVDAGVSDESFRARYNVKDSRDWKLADCRKKAVPSGVEEYERAIAKCLYRPFDHRWILLHDDFVGYPRWDTTRHFRSRDSIGLATTRQALTSISCLVSRVPFGQHKIVDPYNRSYVYPLYLYPSDRKSKDESQVLLEGSPWPVGKDDRAPNLDPEFIREMKKRLKLEFVSDGVGDLKTNFGPEAVLDYAYSILHSSSYRERYAELLRIDFPRVPLISDTVLFRTLACMGQEMVGLHLMESTLLNDLVTEFPVEGSNEVRSVRYVRGRADGKTKQGLGHVYINATQYFEGIESQVWDFHIGGYQVLRKWLKDRKGRVLSFDDLLHYQKMVVVLKVTIRLMAEIDKVIEKHGGWPDAFKG